MPINSEKIIENTVEQLGYSCVDIERNSCGLLRIFIDAPQGVTINDCALVSQHLNRVLTVENIDYETLEVSSPGLDRVLKTSADFTRFEGALVTVKLRAAQEGKKKIKGKLIQADAKYLILESEGQTLNLPFSLIDKIRLVPDV